VGAPVAAAAVTTSPRQARLPVPEYSLRLLASALKYDMARELLSGALPSPAALAAAIT